MIIQTLDIKDNCSGVYYNQNFLFEDYQQAISNCKFAWKHSDLLEEENYTYLYLLVKDEDLSQYSHDPELFLLFHKKMLAHQKAATTAKVSLDTECFFNLIPESQLKKWFEIRHQCLKSALEMNSKNSDYDILHKAHVLTTTISRQNINLEQQRAKCCITSLAQQQGDLRQKEDRYQF